MRGLWRVLAVGVIAALPLADRTAAQDQSSDSAFEVLATRAQAAYTASRWDEAAAGYQAIRDRARVRHDELWEGRGILGLGSVAYHKVRYVEARAQLLDALAIFERLHALRDIAEANDLLGIVAEVASDPDEAAMRYRLAVAEFEAVGNARGRLSAWYGGLRVAPPARSQVNTEFSQLQAEVHTLGDRSFEAEVLHSWGDRLFLEGDYEAAIERLMDAVALLQEPADASELGTVYTSLGRLYRVHGQPAAAVEYQLKALALHEHGGVSRERIQSLNAVAVAYENLGDREQARTYYERALTLAEQAGTPSVISFLRANYGGFLVSTGEPARGRELLAQTLSDAAPSFRSLRHSELARADLQLGRARDAQAESQLALDTCPEASPIDCIYARLLRSSSELALGNPSAALDDQQAAIRALEDLHTNLAASDFLKQGFQQLWTPSYSLAIDLQLQRGKIREALDTAELGRSRALLDLLASRDLRASGAGSSSLTFRGSPALSIRSNGVSESASLAELTAIAKRLRSTLLIYWVADDKIFSWVLSPEGVLHSAAIPAARSRLEGLVRATSAFTVRQTGSGPNATTTRGGQAVSLSMEPQKAWSDLYDLLIRPVSAYLPRAVGARLTVVPHGPLLNLPFAALRDGQGRYLVERYAIHSVPSAAVLRYTGERRRPNARAGPVLLVADPSQPPKVAGEPPLPPLPGASAEVRAIAALWTPGRTTVLAHASATEPRVLAATPREAVIHFATHAIINDASPLSSFLALGRPPDRSASGQLTAEKIYGLSLDADLVVLSACRSGEGVASGDGIATLARAFFYAGAPSLVVSLWDVADEPTSRLLPAFYRAWLGGADKARALRAAQLKLLADLRAGRVKISSPVGDLVLPENPAFWAGFVLLGEPD